MKSGLIDVWNTVRCEEPHHNKFETDCQENYVPNPNPPKPEQIKDFVATMHMIAAKSRKRYKLCDGIGSEKLTKSTFFGWITWVLPFLKEDYDRAVLESNTGAEKYTVDLLYTFFIAVQLLP